MKGTVAAGHPETAKAAELILRAGGNAYDAIIAAFWMSCVAEPVLTSIGGGGFLMAHPHQQPPLLYDFFVQTPHHKAIEPKVNFHPIIADFGTVQQEFHIGLGAAATPGNIKGIFKIHKDLATLPMIELAQPAIEAAYNGTVINELQSYIFSIVAPIYTATEKTKNNYCQHLPGQLPITGQCFKQPDLGNLIESLAKAGASLFYQGDLAHVLIDLCQQQGGYLTHKDLQNYRVIMRKPLEIKYHAAKLLTNPPPSSGGLLIGFALKLLSSIDINQYAFGSYEHLMLLADIMSQTNKARIDAHLDAHCTENDLNNIYDETFMHLYQQHIRDRTASFRGTTHISIIDEQSNVASMTTSNGEGCGYMVPQCGFMLNNMLGEEDINPNGFHQWATNQRMTSMMSPSLIEFENQSLIATGSGGSNRIRTAILQILINLIDYKMNINQAVNSPRIHYENNFLNIEKGFESTTIKKLVQNFPQNKQWDDINLFFGGTHSVMRNKNIFDGVGDPRRGGVNIIVN